MGKWGSGRFEFGKVLLHEGFPGLEAELLGMLERAARPGDEQAAVSPGGRASRSTGRMR